MPNSEINRPPIAIDLCVHCRQKRPGATPWLCLRCLRLLVQDWARFQARSDGWSTTRLNDDYTFSVIAKRRMNRIQRRSRRAWKRALQGLLPEGPEAPPLPEDVSLSRAEEPKAAI